jgi:hypothetical protein
MTKAAGNALAVASLTNLPTTVPASSALTSYGDEVDFLPRIQLVTKGKYVDAGFKPGHYGVPTGEDEIEDLGESIDVLVLAVRDKALDTNQDPPVAVYDTKNPLFGDIKEKAGEKDSGCMYGPSLLVFERTTGRFYEFFLGNKSGRQEAAKIQPFLAVGDAAAKAAGVEAHGPLPCTFKAKYIKRAKYAWHAPQVTKCSNPITNLPPVEEVVDQITKFMTQKTDAPTIAAAGGRNK